MKLSEDGSYGLGKKEIKRGRFWEVQRQGKVV
jgi:hypothetical protein